MRAALRVLLESLIDYAGLFPPASLPMEKAVEAYARHRAGEHAWMLGRFVVPLARRGEVPVAFPVSVLATPAELAALPSEVDVVEVKAANAGEVAQIAAGGGDRALFVEVSDIALIEGMTAAEGARLAAKVRTGGVTPEAIPAADHVAKFLRVCAMTGIPFKATAGLHHPVRCLRPLTYAADAPRGMMHGFINVFMAAALVNDAERILAEEDARAFAFDDETASWRGRAAGIEHLRQVRAEFAISFGSCSFDEPVEELDELGWL